MSLQSLVTHDDPITTTMPVAGSVEVGMSTSKEVKARMTSLGQQTHTPHGWGEGGAHQLGCGRLLGRRQTGKRVDRGRKKPWSTEAGAVEMGGRQSCSEMTGPRLEGEGGGSAAWLRRRIKRFQRAES